MLLYVYAAIALFVWVAFRDWRAVVACCLPLTVGTFVGYWFMKVQGIGLTVATLPVMVLAAGIGVDYALYIYSRLQQHLARGLAMQPALDAAIREVGIATIFTAITLAIGVATWMFSPPEFLAGMGKLLAFMFLALALAMTSLPALATLLARRCIDAEGGSMRPLMILAMALLAGAAPAAPAGDPPAPGLLLSRAGPRTALP
jgi:hypothetical protein